MLNEYQDINKFVKLLCYLMSLHLHERPQNFSKEGGTIDILVILFRLLMLTIRSATTRGTTGLLPHQNF